MNLQEEMKKRQDIFSNYWIKFLGKGKPETLYEASRHLPMGGGKRLRPFLVMLSCESVFGESRR